MYSSQLALFELKTVSRPRVSLSLVSKILRLAGGLWAGDYRLVSGTSATTMEHVSYQLDSK